MSTTMQIPYHRGIKVFLIILEGKLEGVKLPTMLMLTKSLLLVIPFLCFILHNFNCNLDEDDTEDGHSDGMDEENDDENHEATFMQDIVDDAMNEGDNNASPSFALNLDVNPEEINSYEPMEVEDNLDAIQGLLFTVFLS
jgi:hypothetical protein